MPRKKKGPTKVFEQLIVEGSQCHSDPQNRLKWMIRLFGVRQSLALRMQCQMGYLDPLIRVLMRGLGLKSIIASRYFMASLKSTCQNPHNATEAREFRKIIAKRLGPEVAEKAIEVERKTTWKVSRDLVKDDHYLMQQLCRIAGESESLTIGPVTKKAKLEEGGEGVGVEQAAE